MQLPEILTRLSSALQILNKLESQLPAEERPKFKELSEALEQTEKALRDVELAKSLGYKLCLCTFPPQIMLQSGKSDRCPKCGHWESREPDYDD